MAPVGTWVEALEAFLKKRGAVKLGVVFIGYVVLNSVQLNDIKSSITESNEKTRLIMEIKDLNNRYYSMETERWYLEQELIGNGDKFKDPAKKYRYEHLIKLMSFNIHERMEAKKELKDKFNYDASMIDALEEQSYTRGQ